MLASVLAPAFAAPPRIAVLPMAAGEGVSDETAAARTEAVAAEEPARVPEADLAKLAPGAPCEGRFPALGRTP